MTFALSGAPLHGASALERVVRPRQSHLLATFARSTTTSVRMPSRELVLRNPLTRNGIDFSLGTSKPRSSKSKVSISFPLPSRMLTRNQIREASRDDVLRATPRTNIRAPSCVVATRVETSETTRLGVSAGSSPEIVRLIPKYPKGTKTAITRTNQPSMKRGSWLFPHHD